MIPNSSASIPFPPIPNPPTPKPKPSSPQISQLRLFVGEGLAPPSWVPPDFVAATFKWPVQKERSPGSLPGFVWFRVPKPAPQPLADSGGGLELQVWVGSARRTTETFPGALAAALLNNLHRSLRWLRGSVLNSLRYARTSAVLALRKSILASAPLLEICGSVLDCACIGPYIKAP